MFASVFLALLVPAASALETTYVSIRPNTEFCTYVVFGDYGRGEYTLMIEDPGYPDSPWVDVHLASFTSGPKNPVLIPVCINTKGRSIGDEVLLNFAIESPDKVVRYDYGVCVSNHEDADVVESSENPCEAASSHTDLFSFDLMESEIYSDPGEKVNFTLLLSSEFDLQISLDRESGPAMDIEKTIFHTPGEYTIGLSVVSPSKAGDYPFVIVANADNCGYPSCEKKVTGILHVSRPSVLEAFRVELSPKNRNVVGIRSAKFYITIHNFEADQTFSVNLESDTSLVTDFIPTQIKVVSGTSRMVDFTIAPKTPDRKVYIIRTYVENDQGIKKTAESFLTVDEAAGDIQRSAESDPSLKKDADDYADKYKTLPSIDDWKNIKSIKDSPGNGQPPAAGPPPVINWVLIAAAAVAVAAIVFYMYKKTRVVEETEDPYL